MRPAAIIPKPRSSASRQVVVAEAAANQPQLTYSIAPAAVAIASQVTFTFTASNPGPGAVTVQPVSDAITLGSLNQLTNTTVSPVTPASPWQTTIIGQSIQFWVLSAVTINAHASVSFQLAANVLSTPGTANLSVKEVIGGKSAQAPALTVLIEDALLIKAAADPDTIGQQRSVKLVWNTVGGEYVTISPGTGQQFPAGSSSTRVTPNQNAPQTNYTLTVFQGGNSSDCQVTVNLSAPIIESKSFQMTPNTLLEIGQQIQASWTTQYATQITMSPPLGQSPFLPAAGPQTFQPSLSLPANASSEPFTITVYGYLGPVQQTLTLNFAPMRILYLRYDSFPVPGQPPPRVICGYFNAQKGTNLSLTTTPILLTVIGPGGPATAELGGSGPEVQVLLADPPTVPLGESTVISYLVANVVTLTLTPGALNCTFDSTGRGSITVTPAGSNTYLLTAVNGGVQVTSELYVPVS